jgi:hypothetical protein
MKTKYIPPLLSHGREVLAKTVRYWLIMVEPGDELHLGLTGWDYLVYDKQLDSQHVVAHARRGSGGFEGCLFLNTQHSWPVSGNTAKDLVASTIVAISSAKRFYC